MKIKPLLLGAAMAGAFAAAHAVPTVTLGNDPQPGQSILVRNPCGLDAGSGTGTTVLGCLNDNHAQTIQISSDESLVITGGQASLDSTDGTFSQFMITPTAPAGLSTVIFNIDATADGFVTFTDASGTTGQFELDNVGQNFFTLTGLSGSSLSVTTFNGRGREADIIADVKQIRLGVVAAIPEPETYALMMAGLAALGFLSRRRKKRG